MYELIQVSSNGYPREEEEMEYDEKVMRGTNRRLMQNISENKMNYYYDYYLFIFKWI